MTHSIIIGTGAAGISAAEAIRLHDKSARITLIGEEPDGYYSRPGLAYVLTREIPESQLFPFSPEDFQRLKLHRINQRATKIDPVTRQVMLDDSTSLVYDQLLLATGAEARGTRVPGVELHGVVKLDNINDARHILKLAKKARSAVVVGGGITALEIVEGLLQQGMKVHYFLRSDRYWGNVLDETESRIVEHKLKEDGVVLHYHTELEEIIGKRSGLFGGGELRVSAARTQAGKVIPCEIVAIAVGVAPRMQLAKEAGLKTDRGILVNEYLQSSDPRIYAAGDVAQVFDPAIGKAIIDSLWSPARLQGRAAGCNMAGIPTTYRKEFALNVTRLAGLTTTIIGSIGGSEPDNDTVGIVRGDSETWRELPDAIAAQSNFDVNRIRLMVGEKSLLGAIVMGDQKLSQPIHQLVARQVDITPIRERLLAPNARIGEVISEFWETIVMENHQTHKSTSTS